MDEKQLQFLFDQYGSKAGFADFSEFKGLMADSSARKVFFDNSNKDLGFKDYGEFESLLGFKKKDGGPALPSSPSLGLPSVSTEPAKSLTYTDINSSIESLSKAQKNLRELEAGGSVSPGGYNPARANIDASVLASAKKTADQARAERDKVFSEYAGEISRPVEQLIQSQDYTKFFTPSGNIDYGKAREHFQKVSQQFGGGPALVEHWVANLKMRGQGEIERKEVKPLFEQNLKNLGLQKYADQEQYAKGVYEGVVRKNKDQVDLLIQDRDQRAKSLLDQSKTSVDALTADFNQKVEELNGLISAGSINEQTAKTQYDALRSNYDKTVADINKGYQSEVGKINRQVKQKYGRINQELDAISKDKDFVMKSIPEADRKLIDKAYIDASAKRMMGIDAVDRAVDAAGGLSGLFARSVSSGFLSGIASIGDAMSSGGYSNKLVDWMQSKRTSAEELKPAQYEWSGDPLKRAITSSGQSLGASAPLLAPSIGLMAATGGSTAGVVGSALLSYYGENKQNAGQVYRDVLEQSGDVALARDSANEYFQKTAITLPLYFLGSLGEKALVLGKGLKKAVAGFGLELAEEIPVEYIQSHREAVTSQGYKGNLAQYIKENPELMLDIAVGTGVQAVAMKTVAAAFSRVASAAPAPQTQTLADAIMTQGKEFATRLVQTQFDQGVITEQKRDELFQSIGTIEANLAKLDELGVRGDAAKLHMALSQEMAELQARRKSEKDESIQGLLDQQIAELKTQMTGVLTGQTEYIVFGMPGDVNSKTMLASTFNALDQQAKDDVIRSAKSVTVINNPQLNQQLQDQKQTLGNPEGAPEGAYETDATIQSQVEQQAGPAEGGVQERPGVDGGQQEVGQGAGQQGQAPVTQPDTGDRVLSSQEEVALAGELRGELRQDFQPIIDRAAQSLQDFNIESEVLDEEEFFKRNPNASKDTEGAFMVVDKTGKILFNRQAMERVDPGVVIWHEFTHPVMNVIRNTNKPLYDRMVTGLKQLAQKSPELQAAIDWAQGYRKQMEGESAALVEAVVDDESVVDAIARIAADPNIMASLPTSFKQTLIDFINQIAKALGIKARVTNTASADFRRTANEIATRLKSGQSMTELVGAENVGEIENNIARDSGAIETGATVYAGQLRVGESIENTYRESVNLPVRSLESLLAEYGDNVIVVNSDPTGLGTVTLPGGERVSVDGGIGYMALEENISAGVGFAASNDGRVSSFNRIARELQAAGKLKNGKVLVLVMVQKPDSILGNNYTPLYVADALTKIPQSEASRSELVDMLVEPLRSAQMIGMFYSESTPKKGATPDDIEATKAKNEKAKAKGIEKVKKIISEISSVDPRTAHDEMARIFGELSFVQAQKYFETILGGYTNKTTNYTKKISALLYKHAQADQKDLFRRLGEKSLVDAMISSPSDWGYAVAAFVHDVSKQNQKLGGIKHNLFNAKFQGDERFILDRAYRVNDIMVEFNAEQLAKVDRGEKKGAVLAEQQTSQSMYPSGRVSLEGARTMEFPSLAQMGGRYQQSIGGRKMSAAPDYKQRSNVASDNLVRIFQRNNTPLTKDEAIAIVDDLRDWTDWYDGLATYVEGIFGEYAQDVLSLLPLASQANNSAGTVSLAISNAERVYKGESPKGVAEYYGYVSKFLQGMGIESDKMSNFLRAISGNPDAIAVDMHVWSIIKGTDPDKKSVNPKDKAQFDAAKDFVNSVSEAMGIEPRGVQAALWAGNILRTGGKPDSYEQYFADHVNNKGLTERIESWRKSGYQPFTPARKQRQEATGVQLSIGNRQAIIDKAKADGTYLKAPNGQPTNLSEDQWTTVRTPEFKNWFGDWENDPENASKVVDRNGEPMVVVHSSLSKNIDVFESGRIFRTDNTKATPIWFTYNLQRPYANDEEISQYYTFLNAKNIFDYSKREDLSKLERYYNKKNRVNLPDYDFDMDWGDQENFNLPAYIKELGYDGYRFTDEYSIVVFSPNQIKSATSNVGAFSPSDSRIQFSAGNRNLAPNGKRSNLTDRQYQQVRTPEFKAWFGDWENDPTNASKVVDENGEPMVVYHGSRAKNIEIFDRSQSVRVSSGLKEYGLYFSTNKKLAEEYSKAPVRQDVIDEANKRTRELLNKLDNVRSSREYDAIISELTKLSDMSGRVYELFLNLRKVKEFDANGESGYRAWYNLTVDAGYKIASGRDAMEFLSTGAFGVEKVDGVIAKNISDIEIYAGSSIGANISKYFSGTAYLVFDQNKNTIKSATENVGTFSAEDARIQFSAGPRAESRVEFKLVAFVLRKKAEGYTDQQIAVAINSALPTMAPQDIARLIQDPQQYLVYSFPGFTAAQHSNLYERAKIANIFRSAPQRNIHPFFRSLRVDPAVVEKYYERTKTKREAVDEWARSIFTKNFKPSRGLENWMMQAKEFAKGAMNLEIANAKKTIDQLEAVAKEIGFENWSLFSEAMVDAGMMSGSSQLALPSPIPASITRLPLEIQPYVTMMRDQIDGLTSRLIGLGYVTPEQAITLQNNIGQYVNRAYRLFSESDYRPDPKVRNAAIDFLTNQEYARLVQEFYDKNTTPATGQTSISGGPTVGGLANIPYDQLMEQAAKNAAVQVERILNKKANPYFGDAKVESRSIGVLKQKKDIPVEIRRLMGEYTDPGVVFMMTVVKQSALLASSQYLKDLRTRGLGTVFFEANDPNIPPTHSVQMASEGSSVLEPLNGLYTTPEIAEALNYIEPTYNAAMQIWMKGVGMVRMGKTVLSPVTQIINFIGNLGFAVLNGLIFTKTGRPFGAAMGEAWEYAKGQYKTKEDFNAVTKKMIKLGIVGQSVDANSISEAFSSGDLFDVALDVALTGDGIFKTVKKNRVRPVAFFENLYRMGDDFWKVYAYISEREAYSSAKYKKKYADLSTEEQDIVDAEASERVKRTWPTFSRMFPIVRTLNKMVPLLGDFTGFQAESIRNPINIAQIAWEDLKDPDLQASGARRMAAFTAYIGIQTAVTAAIPIMLGYGAKGLIGKLINDDDEEEKKWALDEAAPPHMYHHDKVAVPSEKSPHILTVISMNANNPINWTQLAVNAYFDGTSDMSAGALAAVFEIGSRFLGLGMTTEAVFDVQYNTKSQNGKPIYIGGKMSEGGDPDEDKLMKSLDYVWNKLQPSAVKLYDRWSTTSNPGMEGAAALGFRTYEIDLHKSFSVQLSRASKTLTDIDGELKAVTMFDKKATDEMKKEATDEANEKKMAVVQNLNRLYRAYIKLGADPKVMRQTVARKSAVKLTGMDNKTKAGILNGDIKPNFY